MTDPELDRLYLENGLPQLQEYLLSNELYWPIGTIQNGLPRLTIGGLLLSERRTSVRITDPDGRAQVESLARELDAGRQRWRVAWERKAVREVQSRTKLWSGYLSDYAGARETYAADYPGQVRNRVMLSLLLAELITPPAETGALSRMDEVLRAAFIPGAFLWESELSPAFPPQDFWFLYGRLRD